MLPQWPQAKAATRHLALLTSCTLTSQLPSSWLLYLPHLHTQWPHPPTTGQALSSVINQVITCKIIRYMCWVHDCLKTICPCWSLVLNKIIATWEAIADNTWLQSYKGTINKSGEQLLRVIHTAQHCWCLWDLLLCGCRCRWPVSPKRRSKEAVMPDLLLHIFVSQGLMRKQSAWWKSGGTCLAAQHCWYLQDLLLCGCRCRWPVLSKRRSTVAVKPDLLLYILVGQDLMRNRVPDEGNVWLHETRSACVATS